MGKIQIQGNEYIFQEKEFAQWWEFTGGIFTLLPELTYDHFPWKKFFRSKEVFLLEAGWIEAEKKSQTTLFTLPLIIKLKRSVYCYEIVA